MFMDKTKRWLSFFICFFLLIIMYDFIVAQNYWDTADCIPTHNNGKVVLGAGSVNGFGGGNINNLRDCFTSQRLPRYLSEYPKGTGLYYLRSVNFGFCGIVNRDSLATQTWYGELSSDFSYILRSTLDPNSDNYESAVSELDYIMTGEDTIKRDNPIIEYHQYDIRPHKPLGISVKKSSYSWSYGYSEDFILFEIEIRNINNKPIMDFYFDMHLLPHCRYSGTTGFEFDDIGGLLKTYSNHTQCDRTDTLNLLWCADNDGNPVNGEFTNSVENVNGKFIKSITGVSGIMYLDIPENDFTRKDFSYNWWKEESEFNFGPMSRNKKRRLSKGGTGKPFGDTERYFIASNGEIDYDQIYTSSIKLFDPIWLYPPPEHADDISDGLYSVEHHLSIGPYDLPQGSGLKIPAAYVAGEDFHKDPNNGSNLPNFPDQFYENVDFSDIANNAMWARWIYDNPGVDTDGDGDSGRSIICNNDTIWVEGDGIPDWKAAGPPPAPYIWLEPSVNGVRVRFNGSRSETEKDIFTRIADFEGYNIYLGRDERETSLALVASFDYENYDKFVYLDYTDEPTFKVEDIPYTLEELRCLYGDSCHDVLFNPLSYTRSFPLSINDSLFYFTKHHFNPGFSAITKVYPNARNPRIVPADSLTDDDYTNEGHFKFFEYEYTIENLLPTVDYWVNVTAFDFGSPKSGLKALESSRTIGIRAAYPLSSEEDYPESRQQIYVYPNPYRIDADYRGQGLEGRVEDDRPDYRVRALHFANLPPKCEIKIYSLDGDLIRHWSHDIPRSDPTFRHDSWDLITRNTQMVVSGLYYWTVEFPDGEVQIGKFVVVM